MISMTHEETSGQEWAEKKVLNKKQNGWRMKEREREIGKTQE